MQLQSLTVTVWLFSHFWSPDSPWLLLCLLLEGGRLHDLITYRINLAPDSVRRERDDMDSFPCRKVTVKLLPKEFPCCQYQASYSFYYNPVPWSPDPLGGSKCELVASGSAGTNVATSSRCYSFIHTPFSNMYWNLLHCFLLYHSFNSWPYTFSPLCCNFIENLENELR